MVTTKYSPKAVKKAPAEKAPEAKANILQERKAKPFRNSESSFDAEPEEEVASPLANKGRQEIHIIRDFDTGEFDATFSGHISTRDIRWIMNKLPKRFIMYKRKLAKEQLKSKPATPESDKVTNPETPKSE